MMRNNGREIAARLVILRDYLISNADKTHAVSLKDIQREYANRGYAGKEGKPLNIKTIYSDLAALETDFGMNIKYSERHKGYLLLNPPFEAYELRLLVDSVQASKYITQRTATRLTEKIKQNFGDGRRHNLNRQAYVYHRIRSQNDGVVEETERFHEAISADRKISFRFFHLTPEKKKSYSKDGGQNIVSPYALYWNGGNLYLYAYDGKQFRYYRVDRMEGISKPLPDPREGKEKYNAKELINQKAKMFQMVKGKPYDVKIRFRNNLSDEVIDQFGRDIIMIPDGDKHFTVTVTVQVSQTFFAWVSTFSSGARIISPPEVVEKMMNFLERPLNMYKDDGNT